MKKLKNKDIIMYSIIGFIGLLIVSGLFYFMTKNEEYVEYAASWIPSNYSNNVLTIPIDITYTERPVRLGARAVHNEGSSVFNQVSCENFGWTWLSNDLANPNNCILSSPTWFNNKAYSGILNCSCAMAAGRNSIDYTPVFDGYTFSINVAPLTGCSGTGSVTCKGTILITKSECSADIDCANKTKPDKFGDFKCDNKACVFKEINITHFRKSLNCSEIELYKSQVANEDYLVKSSCTESTSGTGGTGSTGGTSGTNQTTSTITCWKPSWIKESVLGDDKTCVQVNITGVNPSCNVTNRYSNELTCLDSKKTNYLIYIIIGGALIVVIFMVVAGYLMLRRK